MVKQEVRVLTVDQLAYGTDTEYLKKIYSVYTSHKNGRMYADNKGGIQEDFNYTPKGVLWYFGEGSLGSRYPELLRKKFIPNELCKKIPAMIKEKNELMKSLKKHYRGG
jgi:hypothetical protein